MYKIGYLVLQYFPNTKRRPDPVSDMGAKFDTKKITEELQTTLHCTNTTKKYLLTYLLKTGICTSLKSCFNFRFR